MQAISPSVQIKFCWQLNESFNGTLLKFFNGITHVQGRIVKRFLKWRDLTNKAEKYTKNATDTVQELFCHMQSSNSETAKSWQLSESVRVFGNPRPVNVPVRHLLAIQDLFGGREQQCLYHNRFLVNSVLYHSEANTRLQKRNNSVVELTDGTLCKILSIVAFHPVGCNALRSCVLVKELCKSGRQPCRDSDLKISSRFIHEVTESNSIFAVHVQSFKRKCVMIDLKEKMYVSILPNTVERD